MERTIWGSIVSVLGIISLVTAIWLVNTGDVEKHIDIAFAGGGIGDDCLFRGDLDDAKQEQVMKYILYIIGAVELLFWMACFYLATPS